jgi:hypothetical protein
MDEKVATRNFKLSVEFMCVARDDNLHWDALMAQPRSKIHPGHNPRGTHECGNLAFVHLGALLLRHTENGSLWWQ